MQELYQATTMATRIGQEWITSWKQNKTDLATTLFSRHKTLANDEKQPVSHPISWPPCHNWRYFDMYHMKYDRICWILTQDILQMLDWWTLKVTKQNGGHSSMVRASEFKSEDSGFDPLAGQGESLWGISCADLFVPDPPSCAHVKDPIFNCRKWVGLTTNGRYSNTKTVHTGKKENRQKKKLGQCRTMAAQNLVAKGVVKGGGGVGGNKTYQRELQIVLACFCRCLTCELSEWFWRAMVSTFFLAVSRADWAMVRSSRSCSKSSANTFSCKQDDTGLKSQPEAKLLSFYLLFQPDMT